MKTDISTRGDGETWNTRSAHLTESSAAPIDCTVVKNRVSTLEQIAGEAGVSLHTVSRVLRGRTKEKWPVIKQRADRIRAIAARLNYRPNAAARSLRGNVFRDLGLFVDLSSHEDMRAFRFPGVLTGVADATVADDYRLVLIPLPEALGDAETWIPREFRELGLNALVIAVFVGLSPSLQQAIDTAGFAVVYLNDKRPVNSVYVDDVHGTREMTRHLIDRGFRDIVFLKANHIPDATVHYSVADRITAYTQTMVKAGLTPATKIIVDDDPEAAVERWLAEPRRPRAVFCYDDVMAVYVLRSARRLGLSVPGDLAVAGYNNDVNGRNSVIPLTTMEIPFYEMGKAVTNMAIKLANDPAHTPIRSTVMKPKLIVRESTLG